MQTFLPKDSFASSARVLDNKRLGKQRVEGLQILQIIGRKQGWLPNPNNLKGFVNHPAVKMWEANPFYLVVYVEIICDEWTSRGYKDTVKQKVLHLSDYIPSREIREIEWIRNRDELQKVIISHHPH